MTSWVVLWSRAPIPHDKVGNRLWMRALDYPNGQTTTVRTEEYAYDGLDRLIGVSYNGGPPQSWTYDVMGNRSNGGETWVYDGLNRLVSRPGVSYQHDWLGNRLSDNLWTYRWDALNRLVGMTPKPGNQGKVWRYVYRGDGLRVKRVNHQRSEVGLANQLESGAVQLQSELPEREPVLVGFETHYLYDGPMAVLEQDFDDGVLKQTRVHLLGARGIEAVITVDHTQNNQASLQWLMYDGHGNVVRTMSNDGLFRLSAFQFRGVWGERESDLGLGKGYCANLGHPEDETGLVYMRARYYEPWTGRFISEDPSRDGVNWYLYADGNPVGKVDGNGKESDFEAALYQLVGNLMIATGIALLGNASIPPIDGDEIWNYVKKIAIKYSIKIINNNDKSIAAILKLLNFIINTAKKLSEGIPGDELAKRWAGYSWVILGQMLLTDAEIASPGEGEWWGYGKEWPL